MAAKDNLNKNQYLHMVHLSDSPDPPHTVDHFMKKIYEEGEGDRRFTNDVVFMGGSQDLEGINAEVGREYAHFYKVPRSLVSYETYADDDHPDDSAQYIPNGRQLQLTQHLPALRGDAVKRNQVIKYINAREARGSTSFIVPKSLIKSGDIQYSGREHVVPPNQNIEDDDVYW